MKALVKTQKGKGFIEVREVTQPAIKDIEVLIEVRECGICGTDLHIYLDEFPYWPPVVLGHEFSGTVAEVGKNVKDWKVGDRVVGEPHTLACGKCFLCRTGNSQICSDKRSPGWGIDGACAKYMRWPEPHLLHRIPESLSFEAAALVEPLANVVTDIVLTRSITAGDVVAVSGPGPIGIMAALVAKEAGARTVIIIGTSDHGPTRLNICKQLSAIDRVINVQKENVSEIVADLTENRGVDVFIEASGASAALGTGAEIVRKLGVVAAIGLTGKDKIDFPYDKFMMKSVRFLFNVSTKYDSWDRAIQFLDNGTIPYKSLITTHTGIQNWEQTFQDLLARKVLKAMFTL